MAKSIFLLLAMLLLSFLGIAQKDWQVYVFLAEDCPVCNYMGKPLSDIARKYGDRVGFHAVFPFKNSTYKSSQLFKEQYQLQSYETLLDKDKSLTKKLGASVTPEVVITDDQGNVFYRGRINSAYYAPGKMKHGSVKNDLDEALTLILSGKIVPQPWPTPVGCYITMDAAQ
jgi:thiol-disulfide isomerase/thioredoxin